jgi:hypothetical protein
MTAATVARAVAAVGTCYLFLAFKTVHVVSSPLEFWFQRHLKEHGGRAGRHWWTHPVGRAAAPVNPICPFGHAFVVPFAAWFVLVRPRARHGAATVAAVCAIAAILNANAFVYLLPVATCDALVGGKA